MKGSNPLVRFGGWKPAKASLEEHVEANSLWVGNKIYVIGGYQTLTRTCSKMQICDIETGEWRYGPELPQGFPLSHAGIASDGKFLFVVSGQPGPACEPATDKAWALDLEKRTWERRAPLPAARYAPVCEYLDGNLHLISGAIEDRETISNDHFILALRNKKAAGSLELPSLESQVWREGPPIPQGGDHAASLVLEGEIYVIGGEHGHAPMTMDASKCCGTYWVHSYVFRYDPKENEWERLADMPFGSSHIESQVVLIDGRIIVLGGTGDRDKFVDKIQEYDPARNHWRQLDPLPMARKGGVVWQKDGFLYFNGGQTIPNNQKGNVRRVVSDTMAARIKRGSWLGHFASYFS
jgi:N-acetylneuraminic acid mutarotase